MGPIRLALSSTISFLKFLFYLRLHLPLHSLPGFSCLTPLSRSHTHTNTHTEQHKHKESRPQLRQAISLTIQSVFFPMMFPTGTGRRKSDLLPHRAHAVALIWKMISVLLEPINIILVSPVNDTFLPSIVALTEEEMTVTGDREGRRGTGRKRGRNPRGPRMHRGSPSPL